MLLLVVALVAVAQEAAKPSTDAKRVPELTEVQKLKVMNAYQRALVAQTAAQQAQRALQDAFTGQQQAVQQFLAACKAVLTEAKVPDGYDCQVDYDKNLVTVVPLQKPAEAPKPAEAKK